MLLIFSLLWSFLLILLILRANKATLREWSHPGMLPSGPLRCFLCSYILTTVTKFWVAQNRDFLNIWVRSLDPVRKASEQAAALGGPRIKLGEPWS